MKQQTLTKEYTYVLLTHTPFWRVTSNYYEKTFQNELLAKKFLRNYWSFLEFITSVGVIVFALMVLQQWWRNIKVFAHAVFFHW